MIRVIPGNRVTEAPGAERKRWSQLGATKYFLLKEIYSYNCIKELSSFADSSLPRFECRHALNVFFLGVFTSHVETSFHKMACEIRYKIKKTEH